MQAAVLVFQQRTYNFLTGNCHSFVAHFLNAAAFDGSQGWNAVWLTLRMLRQGRSVSLGSFAKTWVPFAVVAALGSYFGGWLFWVCWIGLFLLTSGWFIGHSFLSHTGNKGEQAPVPHRLDTAYSV